jgi:hypothetical protein
LPAGAKQQAAQNRDCQTVAADGAGRNSDVPRTGAWLLLGVGAERGRTLVQLTSSYCGTAAGDPYGEIEIAGIDGIAVLGGAMIVGADAGSTLE